MRFVRFVSVAFRAAAAVLSQNRWRSILTLAMCGVGTAGVMTAGVLAEMNLGEMRTRLATLGGNLLVISPNKLPPFPGRTRQLDHFISLVGEDAAALQRLTGAEAVVPVVARDTTIRFDNRSVRVRLIGTTADYIRVRNFALDQGRFFIAEDEQQRVVVLGSAVNRELRPLGVRSGEILFLGNNPFMVVGVLQPQGVNFAGEDEDHQVFIPLSTYQQRVANRFWLTSVYVDLPPAVDSNSVVKAVHSLLRQRHGRWDHQADDAIIRNLADVAEQQSNLLTTVVWFVTVTSVLLLIAGTVGVTVLMLLVVRQRRPEIGLRRAVGATPVDIAFQFLLEGIVLAGAGMVAGVASACGIAYFALETFQIQAVGISNLALVGILASVAAATVACTIPAIIAAKLQPSVALQGD